VGTLKVHHLNCAHVTRMKLGGQPLACHVVLVETPKNGLVLVDTGLGLADYADITSRLGAGFAKVYAKPTVDSSLAAIRQIAAMGFDPRDVRHIVQTHLDLDHVGGLSDFPWAKVHVNAIELQAATERKGIKAKERYRPPFFEHGPDWQTYTDTGEPWFGFESVRGLVGLPEGIFFVPLPVTPSGTAASSWTPTMDWYSTPVTRISTRARSISRGGSVPSGCGCSNCL
jgi:glyoxylase-like metal-dependent hydrolase (beta-lactamase superfamily II)